MTRIKSTFRPFKKGQKVWLESKNLNLGYHKKIKAKREGPFVISDVLGPTTYRLGIPDHWKNANLHDVFHANLLTPYTETEAYGSNTPRPPPELEEEDRYEVESILKHKEQRNGQF